MRQAKIYNTLTPAYDMVSTVLLMPEDMEELALTLNGKERKIKRSDFQIAMNSSGLEGKIIDNIFSKFAKIGDCPKFCANDNLGSGFRFA